MSTEAEFERRVYAALSADAAATGWNAASPYLKRHMASHASAAGKLDDLIGQTDYLPNADATLLASAMRDGPGPDDRMLAAVFRASLDVQRGSSGRRVRAQRLLIDAARAGTEVAIDDRSLWRPQVCVGSRLDPAQLDVLPHSEEVIAVAFGELDNRPIAVTASDDRTARVWDLTTGTTHTTLTGHTGPVTAVALGHLDHQPIAITASDNRTARVWDLTTGTTHTTLTGHTRSVNAVTLGHLNHQPIAITASHDRTARIWDLTTGNEIDRIELPGPVTSLSFMDDEYLGVVYGTELLVLKAPDQTWKIV